jgi:hypothetical protein
MKKNISLKRMMIAATFVSFFGAGCLSGSNKNQSTVQADVLRQPAPAAAPTAEPTIPTEAAKVPRPY